MTTPNKPQTQEYFYFSLTCLFGIYGGTGVISFIFLGKEGAPLWLSLPSVPCLILAVIAWDKWNDSS